MRALTNDGNHECTHGCIQRGEAVGVTLEPYLGFVARWLSSSLFWAAVVNDGVFQADFGSLSVRKHSGAKNCATPFHCRK